MRKIDTVGKWIWYPDDFEIELSARFMMRRYERDVPIPPFWKQYSCWRNVKFVKKAVIDREERLSVTAEGVFNVTIDGAFVYGAGGEYVLPAGEHEVVVTVAAEKGLPAMKADGETFRSDGSWLVTCNDHKYLPAAFNDTLVSGDSTPNHVKLPTEVCMPVKEICRGDEKIYDFGRQLFAFVEIEGIESDAKCVRLYYGESEQEAFDTEGCELSAVFEVNGPSLLTDNPQAFRYLSVKGAAFRSVKALHEYLPQPRQATFRSSDPLLDEIFRTSCYTLQLTTREFIIDGIKRDRWVWSGDAYQGYLMDYYCFFDCDVVRRTMIGLFGREPFDLHINHIMDYTFYWIMGFCDYYRYTKDRAFAERNFSKAVSALEYCISRTDENGLMQGKEGDWVFIDWAENLDNTGEVCFEQMLYAVSLRMTAQLADVLGKEEEAKRYGALYADVTQKLEWFWDEKRGAYIHSFKNGKPDNLVLRYANIFAILYDLCTPERQKRIVKSVLESSDVQAITTPYMRFYELAALMKMGEKQYVMEEIRSYWGGMLREGATTFWETYDSRQTGDEKYAMYGRRYGKSLCHTWGAGPVYLLGKYITGLEPDGKGGFTVTPDKTDLEWFTATVPFLEGEVTVSVRPEGVSVRSTHVGGVLVWKGKRYRVIAGKGTSVTDTKEDKICSSI